MSGHFERPVTARGRAPDGIGGATLLSLQNNHQSAPTPCRSPTEALLELVKVSGISSLIVLSDRSR